MGLGPLEAQGVVDHELLGKPLLLGAEEGPLEVGLQSGQLRHKKALPEGKLGHGQGLLHEGLPRQPLPQVHPEGEGGHPELVKPGGEEAGNPFHAPHPQLQLGRGVLEAHRPQPGAGEAEPGRAQAGEVYLVRQVKEAVEGDVGREDVHSSLEISRGGGPFS